MTIISDIADKLIKMRTVVEQIDITEHTDAFNTKIGAYLDTLIEALDSPDTLAIDLVNLKKRTFTKYVVGQVESVAPASWKGRISRDAIRTLWNALIDSRMPAIEEE